MSNLGVHLAILKHGTSKRSCASRNAFLADLSLLLIAIVCFSTKVDKGGKRDGLTAAKLT